MKKKSIPIKEPFAERKMQMITEEDARLHKLSFENESLLKKVSRCGCFYCGEIFSPSEIVEWIDDADGKTAQCPYCEIDSVIPESTDGSYELNEALLDHMYKVWF